MPRVIWRPGGVLGYKYMAIWADYERRGDYRIASGTMITHIWRPGEWRESRCVHCLDSHLFKVCPTTPWVKDGAGQGFYAYSRPVTTMEAFHATSFLWEVRLAGRIAIHHGAGESPPVYIAQKARLGALEAIVCGECKRRIAPKEIRAYATYPVIAYVYCSDCRPRKLHSDVQSLASFLALNMREGGE